MPVIVLPVAFAGGALGAALGASAAFIFTGIFVLLGVAVAAGGGGKEFIGAVAFGPLLGPHVSFAGGVAAAAYAARRGYLETGGRDLGKGLAGLGRPDVLAVGGVFGVIGLVMQSLLAAAPFGQDSRVLVVGRPGGPAFRPSELARLTHLTGIVTTVLGG